MIFIVRKDFLVEVIIPSVCSIIALGCCANALVQNNYESCRREARIETND